MSSFVKRRMAFRSLVFKTWFCIPEQGMQEYEILSRATAFLLHTTNKSTKWQSNQGKQFHVVASAHVALPWMHPQYYQDEWEWLQFVSQEHSKHTLEIIEKSNTLLEIPLEPQVFPHSSRDIALLHIQDEKGALQACQELGHPLTPLTLDTKELQSSDTNLRIEGYGLENPSNSMSNQIPMDVMASFHIKTSNQQTFLKTSPLVVHGMCGAPVIQCHNNDNHENHEHDNVCVGMLEGIVPSSIPGRGKLGIEENAAIIETSIISDLMESIE